MKNTMNRINKHCIVLAGLGVLLTGCITHKSTVYHDVERVKVEFENDAAARLFYETLNRNPGGRHSESTTAISIPFIFENEQQTEAGPNVKFNAAVAICDSNKDGRITELEARIFANQSPRAADLQARLVAAQQIVSFPERDKALAGIARDAAQDGDVALARRALEKMTAFTTRDAATVDAARLLARAGQRAEAIDLARTMTSFTERDRALKELAQ